MLAERCVEALVVHLSTTYFAGCLPTSAGKPDGMTMPTATLVQTEAYPAVTLKDIFDAYRQFLRSPSVSEHHQISQLRRLDRVEKILGPERPASDVTTDAVSTWMNQRREDGVTSTTIHNEFASLKAAFSRAVKRKMIPHMLFDNSAPKAVFYRDTVIPTEDMRTIIKNLSVERPLDRFLLLLATSSWRAGDLLKIEWRHIAWESGILSIITSKRRVPVALPLPPAVLEKLRPFKETGLICSLSKPENISAMVRRRTAKLCGTAYGSRVFRHSVLSAMANSGVNAAIIGSIAGHAPGSGAVTQGYSHASLSAKREGIASLPWLRDLE